MVPLGLDFHGFITVAADLPPEAAAFFQKTYAPFLISAPPDRPQVVITPLGAAPRPTESGHQMQALYGFWMADDDGQPTVAFLKQGAVDLLLELGPPLMLRYRPRPGIHRRINVGLTFALHWLMAHQGGLLLHGALLAREGRGILFAGRRGFGKTHTTLELLRRGWDYLADDKLFLHGGEARPFLDTILIRDHLLAGRPWLARRLPQSGQLLRGLAGRQWLRGWLRTHVPQRLLPNEDRLLNRGLPTTVARLFPEATRLTRKRPVVVALLQGGSRGGVAEADPQVVLTRLALLQRLALAEFTHLEWMLQLHGAAQPPPPETILADTLAGCAFRIITAPPGGAAEQVGDLLETCLESCTLPSPSFANPPGRNSPGS
ncbi:MAG: hypothetical protein HQL82_05100 [Magnetococcales bacterium]|nr:hypothetical protein [Magnetococcales bacterium]